MMRVSILSNIFSRVEQSYRQLKTNTDSCLSLVYMVGYQNTVWLASLLPTQGSPGLLTLCSFVCTLSDHLLHLSLGDC